jgi:hypothetical protein
MECFTNNSAVSFHTFLFFIHIKTDAFSITAGTKWILVEKEAGGGGAWPH